MPDGSIWLLRDGKPFALLKFSYMGSLFWRTLIHNDENEIKERMSSQVGIRFYRITKEFLTKMIIARPREFTTDDLRLVERCDTVWLEKNI